MQMTKEPLNEASSMANEPSKPVSFVQAVTLCFSKYVSFSGQASRSEFWWFFLVFVIAGAILDSFESDYGFILGWAVAIPMLSVAVRRLHDTDRSGWVLLWLLVPVVGWLLLLWFFSQKGKEFTAEQVAEIEAKKARPLWRKITGTVFSGPAIVIIFVCAIGLYGMNEFTKTRIRVQAAEGLAMAGEIKKAVARNAASGAGAFNTGIVTPAATENVASISTDGATGEITVTYTAKAGGGTLTMVPTSGGRKLVANTIPSQGSIEWACTGGTSPNEYRPIACRR